MLYRLKRVWREQTGMEAVQAIMIVALAAVIMLGIKALWDGPFKQKFSDGVMKILGLP